MTIRITTCLFFLFGICGLTAQQPIFIDTSYTAEQMVEDFFSNSCVTPSNITFSGGDISLGFFEGANSELGLDAGIVLSTGNVMELSSPSGYFSSFPYQTPGDPDLESLQTGGFLSYDAAVLEFDIMVAEDGDLAFEYVFGSEEYPEYVGSSFNDVFAFWISESGGPLQNISLIPGTSDVVAINSVNADSNAVYYIDYEGVDGQDLALDGLTTPLPATFTAMGNGMYHVKIAIGDISDAVFDSGVFIGVQSLCGPGLLVPPTSFALEQDGNTVSLTNESRYATYWHWDYGNGHTSTDRHPAPYEYAEPGTYTITLTTENYCCENTYSVDIEVEASTSASEIPADVLAIHPNPVTDYLILEPRSGADMAYTLTDVSGAELSGGILNGRTEVQLYAYPPGIYILQVFANGHIWSERIVKQK